MGKRGAAAKQAGKVLEREVAGLLNGIRYPADIGGPIDVESKTLVVQCKHVGSMSLAALERLAIQVEQDGKPRSKDGIVAVKRRAGTGSGTPILFIMTADVFRRLYGQGSEPQSSVC